MKHKGFIIVAAVVVFIVIVFMLFVGSYNGLIEKQESVNNKASTIQAQLQRRSDLIPNLVETVKGYASHEEDVFSEVSQARAQLNGAATIAQQAQANNNLDAALGRLLAIAESYPDLKANENFQTLQEQLEGTENRISVARVDYNDAVKEYNAAIRKFPSSIIASMFGFEQVDGFEAQQDAQDAPLVDFN